MAKIKIDAYSANFQIASGRGYGTMVWVEFAPTDVAPAVRLAA